MNKTLINNIMQVVRRNYSYKSVKRPVFLNNQNLETKVEEKPAALPAEQDEPKKNDITKQIKAKILTSGPITVADYMREVLTSPATGYYMNRDVFGREGDFITSPEISQIFGELVAVWLLMEWQKLGSPSPCQLVELGPGRGTLMRDILRVLSQFKHGGEFSLHLVEISPHLSKLQAQRFCYEHKTLDEAEADKTPYYQSGVTATGVKAFWYKRLEDVPEEFSIILAHEFFDALPVHKLQLDNDGVWKEILIDINDKQHGEEDADFRFVISKSQTPISKIFQPIAGDARQCLEYSLETERLVGLMAKRLECNGGICLIMDYGHYGEKTDTFRAFKSHKLFEPLQAPGTADLTADVDFQAIERAAKSNAEVICFGPIEQGSFLKLMEGDARLEILLQHALPENQEAIKSGYKMLTAPDQMGKRFKFFAIFPAVVKAHLEKFPVQAFSETK